MKYQPLGVISAILTNRVIYVRVTVILMLSMGKSVNEIEEVLGIAGSTVYRYEAAYRVKGLGEYLKTGYDGYWGLLTSFQIAILRSELACRLYTTSKEISSFIQSSLNITYTQEGVVKLLNCIGFSYKQTKEVSCECDIEK